MLFSETRNRRLKFLKGCTSIVAFAAASRRGKGETLQSPRDVLARRDVMWGLKCSPGTSFQLTGFLSPHCLRYKKEDALFRSLRAESLPKLGAEQNKMFRPSQKQSTSGFSIHKNSGGWGVQVYQSQGFNTGRQEIDTVIFTTLFVYFFDGYLQLINVKVMCNKCLKLHFN